MDDSNYPINTDVWLKGMRLGIVLIGVFILGAVFAYLLTGLAGASGSMQAFLALCAGPFLGGAAFLAVWRIRQAG